MPPITIEIAVKRAHQLRISKIFPSYERRVYNIRLAGSMNTPSSVDIAVIVTLSAKSALNMEHHLKGRKQV
jgi:hypothetical protein